jgi:hypothetical protein
MDECAIWSLHQEMGWGVSHCTFRTDGRTCICVMLCSHSTPHSRAPENWEASTLIIALFASHVDTPGQQRQLRACWRGWHSRLPGAARWRLMLSLSPLSLQAQSAVTRSCLQLRCVWSCLLCSKLCHIVCNWPSHAGHVACTPICLVLRGALALAQRRPVVSPAWRLRHQIRRCLRPRPRLLSVY